MRIMHFFMLYASSSDLIYRIRVKSPYNVPFRFTFFLFSSPPAFPNHPSRPLLFQLSLFTIVFIIDTFTNKIRECYHGIRW